MTFLKTLTFTDALDAKPSPILKKRARLLANLREQLSLLNDPTLCKLRTRWIKTDEGKRLMQQNIPVRPWWRDTIDGQYLFFVKSGLKKVEFEKGKAGIVVPDKESITSLIKGLMEATQRGELDILLQEKDRQAVPTRKRAA
jgi:hypothetical protein